MRFEGKTAGSKDVIVMVRKTGKIVDGTTRIRNILQYLLRGSPIGPVTKYGIWWGGVGEVGGIELYRVILHNMNKKAKVIPGIPMVKKGKKNV